MIDTAIACRNDGISLRVCVSKHTGTRRDISVRSCDAVLIDMYSNLTVGVIQTPLITTTLHQLMHRVQDSGILDGDYSSSLDHSGAPLCTASQGEAVLLDVLDIFVGKKRFVGIVRGEDMTI